MEELNSTNTRLVDYDVRMYATVDNRIRVIIPIVGTSTKRNGIEYQDELLRQAFAEKPSTHVVNFSFFVDNVDYFHSANLDETPHPVTLFYDITGSAFATPLPFETFNKIMVDADILLQSRLFDTEDDENQ